MKQKLTILGAGESGTGAALLGQAKGYEVFVSDRGTIADHYRQELDQAGIAYEEGQHTEARVLQADLVVKSPGIPDTAPLVVQLREQGTPVISEIEFAGRYVAPEAKTVLITGTNGKTTTTLLTHHLLVQAGVNAALCGNVGHSMARVVLEGGFAVYVVEVSSFQLDGMEEFRADVATILNITPDHLDRYGYEMQRYVDSKFRVLQNMRPQDHFVYVADDAVVSAELEKRQPAVKLHPVTQQEEMNYDASVMGETLVIRSDDRLCDWYYPTEEVSIKGPHNRLNAMVAATMCRLLGLGEADIREGLANFRNAPHRMEPVGHLDGVAFVNDSKATNVDSVKQALGSYPGQPLVWVAGGIDKGNDYTLIADLVREHVKAVVCLGKDNEKLRAFAESLGKSVAETQDTSEAIRLALDFAQSGDVVLLSPACSSFDLFQNYMDRGDKFRAAVAQVIEEREKMDS